MKYIEFNPDGSILTRYDSEIHEDIPNGVVEVSDELFWRTINEIDGVWEINHTTGEIQKRPLELEPASFPRFTALEMLDLFTEEEQLSVVSATMSVPEVKLWYDRMMAATFVTYEDGRAEAGLDALIQAGLLTEQRKAEIVAAMQPGD